MKRYIKKVNNLKSSLTVKDCEVVGSTKTEMVDKLHIEKDNGEIEISTIITERDLIQYLYEMAFYITKNRELAEFQVANYILTKEDVSAFDITKK